MGHKVRPYLYYDAAVSVCTTCLRRIEASLIVKDGKVFMDKWCPRHGAERVLVADDADYYRMARERFIKPPELPQRFNTKRHYGCPYDCGLCPEHMQHSCLALIEVTDHGRPLAVLAPVGESMGALERLVAAGRVLPPASDLLDLLPPKGRQSTGVSETLLEERAERL